MSECVKDKGEEQRRGARGLGIQTFHSFTTSPIHISTGYLAVSENVNVACS
jgi:hypothetical protein